MLDIGAFDGLDAITYASTGHTVWSFEASPAKAEPIKSRFRDACSANRCNITLYPVALSDSNGNTSFFVHAPPKLAGRKFLHGGLGSAQDSILEDAPAFSKGHKVIVAKRSLDSLVPAGTKVVFAKIDVQGHELSVLRGATRLLATQSVQIIATEWFPNAMQRGASEAIELVELLGNFNYTCTACGGPVVLVRQGGYNANTPFPASAYARLLSNRTSEHSLNAYDNLVCKPKSTSPKAKR